MYSPEKLQELEKMDAESYQFYFKDGPKPTWTKEQWGELRRYQGKKLAKEFQESQERYNNMSDQERKELDIQFHEMLAKVKAEVAAEEKENL